MKYLYVLVNSTTGFYTEQTYISMLSLRHVTPDAFISLLVDDKTANIQDNNFLESIKSLVNEYKVISLPSDMPAIARSRFIKTRINIFYQWLWDRFRCPATEPNGYVIIFEKKD